MAEKCLHYQRLYKRSLRKSCCENFNAHIEITDVARGLEVVKVVKPADVLHEVTVVSIILKKTSVVAY